mmetsp:Transcript_13132/g.37787  ORF Transcript_13132/g.37787 Transcript_13132/m.37787 type:complete len:303 (-) Transcript_13132:45-953(-)
MPLLGLLSGVVGVRVPLLLLEDLLVVLVAALVHPEPQLEELPLALVPWRRRSGAIAGLRRGLAASGFAVGLLDGGAARGALEDGLGLLRGVQGLHRSSVVAELGDLVSQLQGRVGHVALLRAGLPATHDRDGHPRLLVLVDGDLRDGPDDIHAVHDLAEHEMLPVQSRALFQRDEELRAVRVATAVGHAEDAGLCVPSGEVLVVEGASVDTLAAVAVVELEVPGLDEIVLLRPEDGTTLVAQPLPRGPTDAILAGAEAPEVLGRPRGEVVEELEDHAATAPASDRDVEVDPRAFRRHPRRLI